ncbi:MAG TPA: S8 family serine peptidase [Albitalea sp.]|nr:S8 family serine peptidase [Albitalea sp.]
MTRWLAALLLSLLAACAGHAGNSDAANADSAQQILVLLHLPPDHFRPDSSYSGSYDDSLGRNARRKVANRLAQQHGLSLASAWPMPLLGVDCYVMNVPAGQAPEQVAQAIARDPRVAWAQTMNVYRAQSYDDPLYAVQPVASAWHLADLHALATGRQVRVAVIDSGIEPKHPDLAGQIELRENFIAARPFAAEAHGTEVAGIIAARADNHLGIVGVAPRARLLALRACWQDGERATLCNSLSLALALDFAIAHDAQVINMSLAGPPDPLLAKLLAVALGRGIAVVAAVDRALTGGGFPASHPGVIAVADDAATAPPGSWLAPSRDVPTTAPPSRWRLVSGASFAAAHVSGLMALLREANGKANAAHAGATALVRLPTGAIDAGASVLAAQ